MNGVMKCSRKTHATFAIPQQHLHGRLAARPIALCNIQCSAQNLTFVAVRLTLSEAQRERLQPQPATARRLGVSTSTAGKAQTPLSAAPATIRQLQDYISISAQQFQGYIFDVNNEEVRSASFRSSKLLLKCSCCSCTCLTSQSPQPFLPFALYQQVHQEDLLPNAFLFLEASIP